VKADFVNAAAIDGVRYEADVTGDDAYVIGSRLLREALGDDVYLLGSGALIIPSIGIYDGIRVGCDVAPIWKNYATEDRSDAEARNAFMTSVARLWLRPLIDCDPDVVFFRHMKNLLGDREISWLQDVAAVAGFKSSSDPLEWLTEQERSEVAQWLAPRAPFLGSPVRRHTSVTLRVRTSSTAPASNSFSRRSRRSASASSVIALIACPYRRAGPDA